ncbi:hypothetical protein BU16DRAFT_598634 [Lophium mytilinum]|uniref:RNI-like protein n=1 Tax=Lophium mytilinum TaxID=390894 RepID=A0A6A6R8T4_9PEZI|nr:hypothetical protein BU16DRAFT_598634 [Lophium mytilinum]
MSKHVRHVHLRSYGEWNDRCSDRYLNMLSLLVRFPGLKGLELAILDDANGAFRSMVDDAQHSPSHFLKNLRHFSLRIDRTATDTELLPTLTYMFGHPNLRPLKVRSIRFKCFEPEHQNDLRTPLENLHLEACQIDEHQLAKILALPRALESFTLADEIPMEQNTSANLSTAAVVDHLAAHRDSLQNLCLWRDLDDQEANQNKIFTGQTGAILAPFNALDNLEIDLDTLIGTFADPDQLRKLADTSAWPAMLRKIAEDLQTTDELPMLRDLELIELHIEIYDVNEELEAIAMAEARAADDLDEEGEDEEQSENEDGTEDEHGTEDEDESDDADSASDGLSQPKVLEGNTDFKSIFKQTGKRLQVALTVEKLRYGDRGEHQRYLGW